MHPDDTLRCFTNHLGIWAIKPDVMQGLVNGLHRGIWKLWSFQETQQVYAAQMERQQGKLYAQTDDGVAIIRMEGAITKALPKFEGASSVLTRRAIRNATNDEDIESILLKFDSPGGQVDGIEDLAREVTRARQFKIVDAYVEDLAASAAYWVASQARRITSNPMGFSGNIGAFAVLEDLSGLAEREGIRVIVKSTGPFKGMGVPGTAISKEAEDEVQRHVDQVGVFFFRAVRQGRRITASQLTAVTDGRLWIANEAQELGLIDAIGTFEEAVAMTKDKRPGRRNTAARAELARLQAALTQGG